MKQFTFKKYIWLLVWGWLLSHLVIQLVFSLRGVTGTMFYPYLGKTLLGALIGPYLLNYGVTICDLLRKGRSKDLLEKKEKKRVGLMNVVFGFLSLYLVLQWKLAFLLAEGLHLTLVWISCRK